MMDKIVLAGFGGQGVMFIGKVLTYAGLADGQEVCWIPSYGPEMRGGTANCSVIISNEEIYSPVIELADSGIVLNQPSYEKFLSKIKPGGVLVVNSSIVDFSNRREDIKIIAVPGGELASKLGNSNFANIICLGALLSSLTTSNPASVEKAISIIVGKQKPELFQLNMDAIKMGMQLTA